MDSDLNQRCKLPTGKLDRNIRMDGLQYLSLSYFTFICRIKTIHCDILSEEYIVAHGHNIVNSIRVVLKNNLIVCSMFKRYLPASASSHSFDDIVGFIILIYWCM